MKHKLLGITLFFILILFLMSGILLLQDQSEKVTDR